MKNQKTSLKIRDSSGFDKPKRLFALTLLAGLCIFSVLGLYLIETMFGYITISIPPPKDYYDLGNWSSITKSAWTNTAISSVFPTRVYIWRQDTTLFYKGDNIPSWDSIAMYFSKHLSEQGWEEDDSLTSCTIYLPESAFLQSGKNGFLSYHRSSDRVPNNAYEEPPEGDVVCLAIWNAKDDSSIFNVVLLTVKQSPFTNLFSVFDL